MARIIPTVKSVAVNPLKSSQPLGAAFAFLGIDGAVPLFHGSQGCTSFALVLFVRHFKETIPLQTTAMDEVATILGGADHLEEAILNLKQRTQAKLIGICTTALVETRGEDFAGELAAIKLRRASDLEGTEVVLVQTPDFDGAIEEGWSKAVGALIETLAVRGPRVARQVNILPGSHLTVADIELLRETCEAFGLDPVVLPDISGSLDGTIPDKWIGTTYGGTPVSRIRACGSSAFTIAVGEHMRRPAQLLQKQCDIPFMVFDHLNGLKAADRFIALLSGLSGRPVPSRIRRRRSQLTDAMLDGHFHFSGKKVAIAAEPDLLYAMSAFYAGLGASVTAAVTTTAHSTVLDRIPADRVTIGDLRDLEDEAAANGCDLIVTHSHGRQAAERLGVPLMRVGFPIFDRLGSQHRRTILYEGIRDQIFEAARIWQGEQHPPTPESLDPFLRRAREDSDERPSTATD